MERKIQHTMDKVKPYNSLSPSEQRTYNFKFGRLVDYLKDHPNKELPWTSVNKLLPHVYRWSIDLYNKDYAVYGVVDFSDTGIIWLSAESPFVLGQE